MSSWQGHFKRISSFLVLGPGVWWRETNDGFEFFDSEDTPKAHTRDPMMQHFRKVSLHEVYKREAHGIPLTITLRKSLSLKQKMILYIK